MERNADPVRWMGQKDGEKGTDCIVWIGLLELFFFFFNLKRSFIFIISMIGWNFPDI